MSTGVPPDLRKPLSRLVLVPLIVGGAVALHFGVESGFGLARPYVALFLGVLVAAWVGGLEAALATALLAAGVGHFWLFEPGPEMPSRFVSLTMFLLLSMALAAMLNSWRQALRRADAASHAKSRFLATVSHEIRTPMNAVLGMTEVLLDEPLTPEQREYAETIRGSSESLLAVLNDLLDFSKIESGRLEVERCEFDLRACLESALDLLAPGATAKGLELLARFDPSLPDVVIGDPTRLRQILVNLVGNAIKFTDRGEVELTANARLHAGDGVELHLTVRDTGMGIPSDRRDRLFQSFSQIDASTTRRHGGTGLGLAISKSLAQAMGGTVWAESAATPDGGSRFHVTLGVSLPPPGDARRAPAPEPTLAGAHVLVVDDNATLREIVAMELERCGVRVGSAASAADALALLDAGELPDAVLVDRDLPWTDGAALARAIRARQGCGELPVVAMVGADRVDSRPPGGAFAAMLRKPIKRAALHRVLAQTLSKRPVEADESRREDSAFDRGLAQRVPLRILLVEDSPANVQVALRMLERMGYRADVAEDGVAALEAIERERYDLVLMDAEMPRMDGVEATRRIRARADGRRPRIVAVTANALAEDHERYLAAGMDGCVVKPIRPAELRAEIERSAPAAGRQRT